MAENAPTIIGDSILVNGHLQGDEDLTVLGRIHGTVNLTKTLVVEESGVVKADVSVRNAIISGVVVGNVTATDSVELTEAGRMVGDISAPRVIIVDGARFRGNVDMGDLEAPRASGPLPERKVTRSGGPVPSTALAKSAVRPSAVPPPARKVAPPPPPTRPKTEKTKVAVGGLGGSSPSPGPSAIRPPSPASAPATVSAMAPLAGKKKLKKKVVVKKRE